LEKCEKRRGKMVEKCDGRGGGIGENLVNGWKG